METVERGRRLLPAAIDELANDANARPYASVPKDDSDLAKGFHDISYREFANAINLASTWLDGQLGQSAAPKQFPPFSYEGPKDLRFPILAMAAIKTHRTLLVLSPVASIEGRAHLLEQTQCRTMLYAEHFQDMVDQTLAKRPQTRSLQVPCLSAWLSVSEVSHYPYNEIWCTAKDHPTVIFHTSGTTGLPTPVTWTSTSNTYMDGTVLLPGAAGPSPNLAGPAGQPRFYTTTGNGPGLTSSLQGPVWRGSKVVFGPSQRWPDAHLADEVIRHGEVSTCMLTPNVIEEMVRDEGMLSTLRGLDSLVWTGAPLKQSVGDLLSGRTKLLASYGSTEAAGLRAHVCADPNDWNYCHFQDGQGVEFEERGEGAYELIIKRLEGAREGKGYLQPVFASCPELDRWESRDLFRRHPEKERLWAYQGRKDEFVMLSMGWGLQPGLYEPMIRETEVVDEVVIGGSGCLHPFVLVQLKEEAMKTMNAALDSIWETIEGINREYLGELVKIRKDKIVLTRAMRPLPKTEKGTVSRAAALKMYEKEIKQLYNEGR